MRHAHLNLNLRTSCVKRNFRLRETQEFRLLQSVAKQLRAQLFTLCQW